MIFCTFYLLLQDRGARSEKEDFFFFKYLRTEVGIQSSKEDALS